MRPIFLATLLLLLGFRSHAVTYEPSAVVPPAPRREFRGLWVATVGNIDWPSKPGLTTAQQKAELISLLDRAHELKLNAVVFQVRPACDAMYSSTIEPWSEYITGVMGKAPEPFYDPLTFAIEEAHKRGMELHAWFNPYRALHKSHMGKISANHISKTHPELVRSYGEYLWLDPGEPAVREYSLRVVMDVVKRYDVDGVQFDDYFYPYPEYGANRDFPDEASWKKYGAHGNLSREDWRRQNVDTFISSVYSSIKAAKPWVKFGISPFGIWRPGNPPQITGSDAYVKLSADSRKWLMNGWVDYFSPQLYWRIEQKEQSFPVLLDWWAEQNVKHRHLWPGLSVSAAVGQAWNANEIPNQIRLIRKEPGSNGYILYNASSLFGENPRARGLQHTLLVDFDQEQALVPASPWLGGPAPAKPSLSVTDEKNGIRLAWNDTGTNAVVRWWIVQTKSLNDWKTEILPGNMSTATMSGRPEVVAVAAVNRVGEASAPRVLQLEIPSARKRILQSQ